MSSHLRLSVKRQPPWHKIPVAQRHASIEISMGNERCKGDYLAIQLTWARDRFHDFRFSIGDTLQLHNYVVLGHPGYGRVDETHARKICLHEGDDWLEENQPIIETVLAGKQFSFIRWDELLAEPTVKGHLYQLTELYLSDEEIFSLVRQDVAGYLDRRGHRLPDLSEAQHYKLDLHVLEELAVYQYQAEELDLISVYPGSNQLLLRPKHLTVVNLPRGLKDRRYVTLDIRPVDSGMTGFSPHDESGTAAKHQ